MKIAAVVILYHPGKACINNLLSYYKLVNKLYVFDNSEIESDIKPELLKLDKVNYYHDKENAGLPKRLNEACNLAINDGFDWLLTMDQDSCFLEESFVKYLDCFSSFENKENVAMFGTTNYRLTNTSTNKCQFTEDKGMMTSGTLMNLTLFKKIGDFDEALFIDCVDHDYNIRAGLAGYKMIRFANIFLQHELGKAVYRASVKTLFLLKKKKEIHSPIRFYYMYRNMLYLTKKFEKQNLAQVKQLKKDVISRINKGILYGRNTLEICKYVRMGYKDYLKNKMGKL